MHKKIAASGQKVSANPAKNKADRGKPVRGGAQNFDAIFDRESNAEKQQIVQIAAQMQMRQSPYPPAEEARAYEEVCPGAFDRILAIAEKANDSRINGNARIIRHKIKIETTLAWLGWAVLVFLIAMLIGAAVLCALSGHDWVAGALGISSAAPVLAGVIGKFIPARRAETEKKD